MGQSKSPNTIFLKGELWVSPHLTNMSQISMPYYSDSKSKTHKKESNKKKNIEWVWSGPNVVNTHTHVKSYWRSWGLKILSFCYSQCVPIKFPKSSASSQCVPIKHPRVFHQVSKELCKFPMCSYQAPKGFSSSFQRAPQVPNVFSNMFPIAHFHPICFAQSSPPPIFT